MWIKNQNETLLINVNAVEIKRNRIRTVQPSNNEELTLGVFETEEAAKKEFEYIEMAIIGRDRFYQINKDK